MKKKDFYSVLACVFGFALAIFLLSYFKIKINIPSAGVIIIAFLFFLIMKKKKK